MKILLTGCTGFVGSHILNNLLDNKVETRALLRKDLEMQGVEIFIGNLMDLNSLKKATKDIDVVINAAASTPNNDLSGDYEANTIGVKNLVDACKYNKSKLLHISSISVTFKIKGKYAKTKEQGEKIISKSNIRYTIIRPTGIYGPDSPDFKKIIKIYGMLPFTIILGKGEHKLQPVYVKDVAKAVFSITSKNIFNNEIYNIAGPESFMFKDSIDTICKALGKKRMKIFIPKKLLTSIAKLIELTMPKMKVNPERIEIIFQNRDVGIKKAIDDFGYKPLRFEIGVRKTLKGIKHG